MEWVLNLFSRILSNIFSKKEENYKQKVEKLRRLLVRFDKACTIIEVENDKELINRASGYIGKWKNEPTTYLDKSLLDPIERLVKELKIEHPSRWYRIFGKSKL